MPTRLLSAYLRMMPSVQAERSLAAVTQHAVGGGLLKRHQSQAIIRSWQRDLDLGSGPVLRPKSREQYHAQIGAVGIGVRFEKSHG